MGWLRNKGKESVNVVPEQKVPAQDVRTKRILDSFDDILLRMDKETKRLERVAKRLEK